MLSTPRPKRPIALQRVELAQQIAGQLGIGDQHRVGVARDREDIVGGDALRHAEFRVERASAAFAGSSEGNGLSVTAIRGRAMTTR